MSESPLSMPTSDPYGNDDWKTVRLVVEYRFRAPADFHLPRLGVDRKLPLPPMHYSTGMPSSDGGPGTWRSHEVPPLEFMSYRHKFEVETDLWPELDLPDDVEREAPHGLQPRHLDDETYEVCIYLDKKQVTDDILDRIERAVCPDVDGPDHDCALQLIGGHPMVSAEMAAWAVREAGGPEKARRGMEFDDFPAGTVVNDADERGISAAAMKGEDGTWDTQGWVYPSTVRDLYISGLLWVTP